MCGIAGVRKFGETPITGEELILLLCMIEHRGQHATGIALENPDGVHVHKAAMPAWQFTKSPEFIAFIKEFLTAETTIALLHTRWATTGNPEINVNNHPIFDGETAITHNGMIHNHQVLFTNGKYDRICETDSDIIRATVAAHGFDEKAIRELCKMGGSAAIACISAKHPGKLMLARSGSPLVYGFTETGDKLYWASEAHAITTACRTFHEVHGVWVQDARAVVSIGSMPDNTAWVFNDNVMELHHKFNVCAYYRSPDYSKGRESYHTKVRNWKRELKRQMHAERNRAAASVPLFPHYEGRRVPTREPQSDNLKEIVNQITKNLDKDIKVEPGSVIKCPGCGTPLENKNGKPWKELSCSICHSALEG